METLDLTKFICQEVVVTFCNGITEEGTIKASANGQGHYPVVFNSKYYTKSGKYCQHRLFDIVSVQVKLPERYMKKSEELQLQIAQLEGELEVAMKAERVEELSRTIPEGFDRESCLSILDNPTGFEKTLLSDTFLWEETMQGYDFWDNEYENYRLHGKPPSDEAIIQLQKWVIMWYRKHCGEV
jgi:hypothetical protein